MKKLIIPALLSIMVCTTSGKAMANDDIDFRDVSCREFIETMENAAREDSAGLMLWLNGYANGLAGNPVLSWGKLEDFMDRVADRCRSRGSSRLLDVIDTGRNRR